jgi:outer membrane receptor protein involved in Fe transport
VYALDVDKHHNLRLAYNRAYRAPAQTDQYLDTDLLTAVSKGNVGAGFQGYTPQLGSNLVRVATSANPLAELAAYATTIAPLRLEKVTAFEAGYKGVLGKNLVADLSYYQSYYRDFIISSQPLISNVDGRQPSLADLAAAAPFNFQNPLLPTRVVVVSGNLDLLVRTQGALASLTYKAAQSLSLTGNYSLSLLRNAREEVPFYNTPKHKFNVGAFGELRSHLCYRLNYHWAQGHAYESTFAAGYLAAYHGLDAEVCYPLPKLSAVVEIGGTNLLNTNNVQVYGGPQIGQLLYTGLRVSI